MKRFLSLVPLLFMMNQALADSSEYYFKPNRWSKGVHLLAGAGISTSVFNSNQTLTDGGYGLHIKSDLGYYLADNFAVEWSSNVKFNKVQEYLVWDTLITVGLRYRFEEFFKDKSGAVYTRAFFGKSPTVIFFNGNPPEEYKGSKASRLQFDGPIYGLAFGKMYEKKDGSVWWIEFAGSFQTLEKREAIYMDDDVPVVVSREEGTNSMIYSMYATIGIVVF
jgi:hypothetical protein